MAEKRGPIKKSGQENENEADLENTNATSLGLRGERDGGGRRDDGAPSGNRTIAKVIIIVLGIGISVWVFSRLARPVLLSWARYILDSEKSSEDYVAREIPVEAERTCYETMPKHINTIGELKANASVMLHSEINGRIQRIAFREGSTVAKGDLLIKLDDDHFQAELRGHQAQYQAAKAEFERFQKMVKAGTGSRKEYEKALADMNVARSRIELSLAQIRKTEILAPFEGVIGLIDVGEGAFVRTEQELVMLVDQTPIKVKFGIPGKFVNDVGVDQAVELKVAACGERVFIGHVEAVDSHVDTATNCVSVRASVPNEDGVLKAGLFASVSLVVGEEGEVITVDESALERMGEDEYVWVVVRGRARKVKVLTGVREKGRVSVVSGVKPGQIVVTAGQMRLTEGCLVKLTNLTLDETGEQISSKKSETASGAAAGKSEAGTVTQNQKPASSPLAQVAPQVGNTAAAPAKGSTDEDDDDDE
jgi:membrane fusion protein (multidrug efflux system)